MIRRFVVAALAVAACTESDAPDSVLYVADRAGNRVVQYDGATGAWLGELVSIDRPSSVRLGPDGLLYVAGFGQSEVVQVDPHTGALVGRFFRDTTILEEPVELTFRGPELVVLGNDTNNAVVIDPAGLMTHDIGYPDMRGAHDFVFGTEGLLYVATEHELAYGTALQAWDIATGQLIARFGALDEVARPTGIALIDGALVVTDYERGTLVRFDGKRATVLAQRLRHPTNLDLAPDGYLYVIDDAGIHRFDRDGTNLGLLVDVDRVQLVGPRSMTFVPIGDLE